MTTRDWIVIAVVAVVAGAAGAGMMRWSTERESEEAEEAEAAVPAAPAVSASQATVPNAAAKITEDSARVLALVQVPGGKIEGGELETEGGKLLYSFDIKVAGKPGVEEIHISALTGELLSHEHETAPTPGRGEGEYDRRRRSGGEGKGVREGEKGRSLTAPPNASLPGRD